MSIRIGDRIISGNGGAADGESLINQNTSSSIEKVYNWVGTIAEYEEQDVANAHPEWVCYILDDEAKDDEEFEVYEISGRNVGDIFFTSRKDINLSGAVECDGSVYSLSDYEGVESVEELLKSNKLPYVSISEYNTLLETNGSVGIFGWDGINASTFKVPTLNNVFIESGKVNNLGEFIKPGLPNITGRFLVDDGVIGTGTGAFYNTGTTVNYDAMSQSGTGAMLGFNASRSSDIYGNSTTVQPQSVCYRPMVQLATGIKEESIYNIENHALFDNRITNCITNIPQDIKLELNNGTLTLKAGSKFYIPNGFEEDGTTRKFDEVILTENKTDIFSSGEQIQHMCFYSFGEDYPWGTAGMSRFYNDGIHFNVFSGDTQPTCDPSLTSAIWYDTANNVIKCSNDSGATWKSTCRVALPLGLITVQNNTWTSIDQVFNEFGFIGNATFVLPGVKGLASNGKNEDGTLKNIVIEYTKVAIMTGVNTNGVIRTSNDYFVLEPDNKFATIWEEDYYVDTYPTISSTEWALVYDSQKNQHYRTDYGTAYEQVSCLNSHIKIYRNKTTGQIININKESSSFKAQDYNDTEYIGHQAMPSNKYIDLTLGASGALYTAPADGYVCLIKESGVANEYVSIQTSDGTGLDHVCFSTGGGQKLSAMMHVSRHQKYKTWWTATGSFTRYVFVYANGSK